MLDFTIYNANFLILFGVYFTFFSAVFGVSKAVALLKEKSR